MMSPARIRLGHAFHGLAFYQYLRRSPTTPAICLSTTRQSPFEHFLEICVAGTRGRWGMGFSASKESIRSACIKFYSRDKKCSLVVRSRQGSRLRAYERRLQYEVVPKPPPPEYRLRQ